MKFDIFKVTKRLTNRQVANILTSIGMVATPVAAVWSGFSGKKLADLLESYKQRERSGEDIPWQTKFIEISLIVGGPAAVCILGMACTYGANKFNAAEIAALATAGMAYKNSKQQDKPAVEQKDNKQVERLDQTMIKEDYKFNPEVLFTDGETGTTFLNSKMYIDKVVAETKLAITTDHFRGDVTYWYLADELGFTVPEKYSEYGWWENEFLKVDAEVNPHETTDGRPAFELTFNIAPHKLDDDRPFDY